MSDRGTTERQADLLLESYRIGAQTTAPPGAAPRGPDLLEHPTPEKARALLIRALVNQAPIAFVGSGLSAAAANYARWDGLPGELLHHLAEVDRGSERVERALDDWRKRPGENRYVDGLGALSAMQRSLVGKRSVREAAVRYLETKVFAEAIDHPEIYQALLDLPFHRFVTTNYDHELERAIERQRGVLLDPDARFQASPDESLHRSFTQEREFFREHAAFCVSPVGISDPMVFHCHGRWDRADSMILTDEDYARHYYDHGDSGRESGYLQRVLDNVLRSNTVVFVGFSLEDREIQRILRPLGAARYQRESKGHLFTLEPWLDADSEDGRIAERRRLYLWSEYRIITVRFDYSGDWAAFYTRAFQRIQAELAGSVRQWSRMPKVRSFARRIIGAEGERLVAVEQPAVLWAAKNIETQMGGELNATLCSALQEEYRELKAWCSSAQPLEGTRSSLWISGPPGSGKLRFLRACYGAAQSLDPKIRVVYVNLHRLHDVVSIMDRVLASIDPGGNVSRSRAQRLRDALSRTDVRCMLLINGFELLVRNHRGTGFGGARMRFVGELVEAITSSSGGSRVVVTSRVPIDLRKCLGLPEERVDAADHVVPARDGKPALSWRSIAAEPTDRLLPPPQGEVPPGWERLIPKLRWNRKLACRFEHDVRLGVGGARTPAGSVEEVMKRLDSAHRRRPLSAEAFHLLEEYADRAAGRARRSMGGVGAKHSEIQAVRAVAVRLVQCALPLPEQDARALASSGLRTCYPDLDDPNSVTDIVFEEMLARGLIVEFLPPQSFVALAGAAPATSVQERHFALDRDYAEYVLRHHLRDRHLPTSGVDVSDFDTAIGVTSPSSRGEGRLVAQAVNLLLPEPGSIGTQDATAGASIDGKRLAQRIRLAFAVLRGRAPSMTATDWEPGLAGLPGASWDRSDESVFAKYPTAWEDPAGYGPHDWYISRLGHLIARIRDCVRGLGGGDGMWSEAPPVWESKDLAEDAPWRRWHEHVFHPEAPLQAAEYLWIYNELTNSLLIMGSLREALAVSKLTARIAAAVDLNHAYRPYVVQARLKEIHALISLGLLQPAREAIEECRGYVQSACGQDDELWWRLEGFDTYIEHLRGNLIEADGRYARVVDALKDQNERAASFFAAHWGQALISKGDYAGARRAFLMSEAVARRVDLPVSALYAQISLVRYHRHVGDPGAAMHFLRAPYDAVLRLKLRRLEVDARFEMSAILASTGDRERAKREALKALHVANRYCPGLSQTKALIAVGRAHLPEARSRVHSLGAGGLPLEHSQELEYDLSYITEEEREIAHAFLVRAKHLAIEQSYWVRARVADRMLAESGLTAYLASRR